MTDLEAIEVEIDFATDVELRTLLHEIQSTDRPVKGDVRDWRFIAIRTSANAEIALLGAHGPSRNWFTSSVIAYDPARKLVLTRNSVYRLVGTSDTGPLPVEKLRYVVMADILRRMR